MSGTSPRSLPHRRSSFGRAVVLAVALFQSLSPSAQTQPDDIAVRIVVLGSAEEAERTLARLRQGENFVLLATTLSHDPSAAQGGLVAAPQFATLRAELKDAARGLRVGELSGIVQIPTGFAILKVVPRSEGAGGVSGPPSAGLTQTGAVKYALDVSGFSEANVASRQIAANPSTTLDLEAVCRARTGLLDALRQRLETQLSSEAFQRARPTELFQVHYTLAQVFVYHGRMAEALAEFEKAYDATVGPMHSARPLAEESLGIAYLHKAAMDNGVDRAPGDRCLLSIAPGRPLARPADANKAITYFTSYLAEHPDDLEVQWLLNVAHMLAGSYPAKVPPKDLIPPAALRSAEDVGRFVDVAPQAGLDAFASAGGVIVDDFDNDGRLDVVTSSLNACAPMHFFRRNEQGRFVDRTAAAGLSGQLGGLNMLQTDYDNDGHVDILVLRGGWEFPQRKSLLRNNGDGTFTDVTVASGLARPVTQTQTAAWTDFDNDGLLDLFVGNESSPAQLFKNNGDGTFEDVAARAGVGRIAFTKGVAAADYDNDGWPDLYVSNMGGVNFLYRNNRNGTFTEIGGGAGVAFAAGQNFATWFFDYDNDGWQDLFVSSYFTSIEETAKTYLNRPNFARPLGLYRNQGDGSFENVSRRVGLDKVFMPMGANFGDIDNDGFLDIYLGTGNPSYGSLVPSALLHNKGGTSFVDVTTSSGTGELHKGHGVAFADLDRDGGEDIVFEVGGATPGDAHALRLFQNPGHAGDWIAVKLSGVKTNRAAIGARITVRVENDRRESRTVHRTVGSGGSFGASPLEQHIGLGKGARRIDVDVWWPTSNTRQHFRDIAPNQAIAIAEFADRYQRLRRPPLPLTEGKGHGAPRR